MVPFALTSTLLAFLVTTSVLWLLLPHASRLGLIDHPGGRKAHEDSTPSVGGLAMAVGAIAAILACLPVTRPVGALLAGCGLLAMVGAIDDIHDLRWYWRIGAQVLAALCIVYGGGVRVDYVGHLFGMEGPAVLGEWSVPFTVVGVVGVINAINMCDGSDGLSGMLCAATLCMLGAASLYAGNAALALVLLPFLGAVAGFLAFNLRTPWRARARSFMGNSGSEMLGLVIAWAAVRLTQNAAHPVSPLLAPWLMAPPVVDCIVLAVRRMKLGRSPFKADRGHMHHLLQDAGFGCNGTMALLVVVSCGLGLAAALMLKSHLVGETGLLFGFLAIIAAYYLLTSKHDRAIRAFVNLRRILGAPLRDPDGAGAEACETAPQPAAIPLNTSLMSRRELLRLRREEATAERPKRRASA